MSKIKRTCFFILIHLEYNRTNETIPFSHSDDAHHAFCLQQGYPHAGPHGAAHGHASAHPHRAAHGVAR